MTSVSDWQLLTPANIQLRRVWGWGYSIQKILAATRSQMFDADQLMIASDYGGEHRQSSHLVYAYLIVAGGLPSCLRTIRATRRALFRDDRRMAYKRLDDAVRRKALPTYLRAAGELHGCLVAVAIDKKKAWLSTQEGVADEFQGMFKLRSRWSDKALERMVRKVHLMSLLLSVWARPHCNITWITDDDEFVSTEARHDDALSVSGTLASMYTPLRTGVFRLNRTGQVPDDLDFEDLCSIPDLACGMLSEIMSALDTPSVETPAADRDLPTELPWKSEILSNWFWDEDMPLRKVLITVDVTAENFIVQRMARRIKH